MGRKITDTEINLRIMPTASRWPSPETARTIAWDRLRDCTKGLRDMAHALEIGCQAAEADPDLSPEGRKRRKATLGAKALAELEQYKPFLLAEKAALNDINHIEEKMISLPPPATGFADALLAQEIRSFLRAQEHPIDAALKNISDPKILGAAINAPAVLSGLTETEAGVLRDRARTVLHPDLAAAQADLTRAVADVREGVAAARRVVIERTELQVESEMTKMMRDHHQKPAEEPSQKARAAAPAEEPLAKAG